jgi:RNA polymerase sigma factor (sigma-70 family)
MTATVTALALGGSVMDTAAPRMTDGALTDKEQDRLLVERAQAGDTAAFDSLVLKYTPRLFPLVYNMTANRDDASDVLQDVFSRAYRCLRKFRNDSGFHTWIHSIAVNLTLNFLKRRNRRQMMSLEEMDTAVEKDGDYLELAAASDPVREAGLHELQQRLNAALMRLSEAHRAVVVMFDIQGLPHAEIGKIMGVSEGTVRSRLHYAHRLLKEQLADLMK